MKSQIRQFGSTRDTKQNIGDEVSNQQPKMIANVCTLLCATVPRMYWQEYGENVISSSVVCSVAVTNRNIYLYIYTKGQKIHACFYLEEGAK
jgi:hypothetical protein